MGRETHNLPSDSMSYLYVLEKHEQYLLVGFVAASKTLNTCSPEILTPIPVHAVIQSSMESLNFQSKIAKSFAQTRKCRKMIHMFMSVLHHLAP